jgi:hypothetical protein
MAFWGPTLMTFLITSQRSQLQMLTLALGIQFPIPEFWGTNIQTIAPRERGHLDRGTPTVSGLGFTCIFFFFFLTVLQILFILMDRQCLFKTQVKKYK